MSINKLSKKIFVFFFYCFMAGVTHSAFAHAFIYANDELVFAGNSGYIYHSTDGKQWTQDTITYSGIGSYGFNWIAYNGDVNKRSNNGTFIIAADIPNDYGYNVFYSALSGEETSWYSHYTKSTFPFIPERLFAVNGHFVATVSGRFPYFSTDGQEWKSSDNGATHPNNAGNVASSDSVIVALRSDLGTWDHLRSTDGGNTWVSGNLCSTSVCKLFMDIAYAKDPENLYACKENIPCVRTGMFVVVGVDETIYTSSDGANWTAITSLEGKGNSIIYKVIYSQYLRRWIAVGDNATGFYSDDGFLWKRDDIYGSYWDTVDFVVTSDTSGLTVAGSLHDNYCMFQSINGYDWKATTFCQSPIAVVWHSTLKQFFAAIQGNGPFVEIYSSKDGVTWGDPIAQLKTGF